MTIRPCEGAWGEWLPEPGHLPQAACAWPGDSAEPALPVSREGLSLAWGYVIIVALLVYLH